MWARIKNFFSKYVSRDVADTTCPDSRRRRRLDDCENEVPVKLARLQEKNVATQSTTILRNPLASDNRNPIKSSEMRTTVGHFAQGAEPTNTSPLHTGSTSIECVNIDDDDDDLQVVRVYESLARKADREGCLMFKSASFMDSRQRTRSSTRSKTDRHHSWSTLDKSEDLEQHQRYMALLHENSTSHNSGYKNDPLSSVAGSYSACNTGLQVEKPELGQHGHTHTDVEYPSSRSAELLQSAKYTSQWIADVREKRKKSYREEVMKAERTQELTQHLHKHNEKYVQAIEKSQWDWRTAFEIFKIEDEASLLPTLTPEMEEEVRKALVPHPENEKLISASKITITRKDMNTLRGLNWLNDEVINCYMDLIKERGSSPNGKYPKVLTFNTFFYPNLNSRGNTFLKRWNRKIDLFSYDMILAPIHEGIHWCLVKIDFRSKKIIYLDSMGGKNSKCLELFLGYLVYESNERNVPFNHQEWRLEHGQGNPKQKNGSDCGVFACTYAEFLSRDAKFTFDQLDMPFMRRKMVYELLHGLLQS